MNMETMFKGATTPVKVITLLTWSGACAARASHAATIQSGMLYACPLALAGSSIC